MRHHYGFERTPASLDTGSTSHIALDMLVDWIEAYARQGADLYLHLSNDEAVRLINFFHADAYGQPSLLVANTYSGSGFMVNYRKLGFPVARDGT
ncbi:BapA/Bap/LapF family prefix-like domain-containing protein [Phyllobacterium phragmitis]|uniref:BapA/Bap/LapF family prefix-like domain-containing protein n=1 Tax=Phyllobacterium phragmitis TaxID=2670329 RepID=UPI003CC946C7